MSSVPLSQQAAPRAPRADAAYLDGLNPEQRAAVEAVDGAVLVLAGAGTGKTRVLTTRLAHILATGKAQPWNILAVTFTNKAAREMKERVGKIIGEQVEGLPWLGTFHSIAAQILRRHAELVGLKSTFTILDTDDQLRLLKQILEAEGIDTKRWTPRHLASLIDGWKNRAQTPERIPEEDKWSFADGKARKLYKLYQDRLSVLNACDFGDLLLHNITIFQNHDDVLADFHRKFRYLLVDEYQDTNVAQYLWLRLLARGSGNVCCVGDDDQSIYGWRGAEVDNILRFEQDFPGATVIRLERNYRSTGHILGAAAGLITANKARLGKTLWTEDQAGHKVQVSGLWDGEAEARFVADEIEAHIKGGGRHSDIAVLVRASWQMRAFEDRFIMLGLPYKVIGGPRFFERAEIRDALAYLRLVRSLSDDLAFERVVNTPKRGVGDTSVQKIAMAARGAQVSMAEAARLMTQTDEIKGKGRTGLIAFLRDLDRWAEQAETMRHDELAEVILDESGYTAMWREDKSPQAAGRLDNLKELVRSMGEFDSLEAFLEHIALVSDADRTENGDEVSIMTLHAAKGLEFPLVFLPGWEETVFPSQRSMDEGGTAALEEERRLAYVGITRARERAVISFTANRMIFGRWQSVLPSRFIDEMPAEHCEAKSETGYYDAGPGFEGVAEVADPFKSSYESPGWKRFQASKASGRRADPGVIEGKATLIDTSSVGGDSKWKRGDRVFHQKFGYGTVKAADGAKLTVAFDKAGEKKVVASFVEEAP
ncbi:MAG: DNA helicase II [Oceanicaulis sp.]|uniref:ATP-dependent helicase n=2 Tax=unclassified Oceanicaulis TaxID=2632123 RepID=UPI000C58B30C|nr:UvrD-helicase domain-containing protein [Oceanicaulis sp.]MAB68998.1 DNA helicase II [Oceanicaulis sp.]MBC39772.1 DNA helicase II [Oceanicaulis sp.]MBG36081.1 DNA helicase II [Oceanicaulis sp.]|tara:strand:+ start:737 stop:3037 length:2301 start_codon:yes stop_codon:yes gene_type:complete